MNEDKKFIKNRKIKKILNKHLSQEEGQKIRVQLNRTHELSDSIYDNSKLYYRADYYKTEKIDGVKTRVHVIIYHDSILDILNEHIKDFDITRMELTKANYVIIMNGYRMQEILGYTLYGTSLKEKPPVKSSTRVYKKKDY